MIIKSSAGTEIAKNGYTVIDELNQIPMIKTNYLQLEHNHINPIILGSKAFEHKDIFINVVEDTETNGDTAFKEYNAIHEFAWILSGMRKHDSYTGYLSLEQYLTMVLKDTDFTYQVEGGHQYYALQFENLGDGESHLDMFFKMLNRWNTEFELRGKKVYITHQRGRLRDKHVGRYKMNIIDTIINSDITDGATAVWGYFGKKDEENPENSTYREFYWQIDELVEQYGIRYAKPYSNENITQEETMIEYLNNIILDSWKISTEVDIAEITDEVVQTGDEYVAVDERLGITLNTRIQKLETIYDADDKLLYQTATLGTVSFASAASGSSNQLQEVIEKIKKDYSERITDLKQEFDNRFNDEVTQIEIEFNKLVNGVRQEIQADKEAFELRYKADKEALSSEIQSSYTNAVTEANRIVEAKETDFKNYADGIGSAANGRIDDLYEGFGDLSSEFENLEIGGRNLVTDSHFYGGTANGWSSIYGTHIVEEHIWKKTYTRESGAARIERTFWGLEVGQTYTLTMYMKTDTNIRWSGFVAAELIKSSDTTASEEYKIYSVTFRVTSEETVFIRGYQIEALVGSYIHMDWFTLVKGNVPTTDWTPAPEDVDQKLTIIANDLDGVQTKVENNTGAITTVTQQANGLETRVENAEGNITTVTELANGIQQRVTDAEGNINTVTQLATGTQQRVTDAEGNINTITNIANGTQQTVTNMLNGKATKGTIFQNTVDGFLNRVWQTDIDNLEIGGTNLLQKANMRNWANANSKIGESPRWRSWFAKVEPNMVYSLSRQRMSSRFRYYLLTEKPFLGMDLIGLEVNHDSDLKVEGFTTNSDTQYIFIYYSNTGEENPLIKLEKGNKSTDYSLAPEDLMKYTDIIARPDGFLIGSFEMGGDKIAQAIVGKAGAIDLIAQNVNFTGNVNVANQIKAYSLEAVYADIAKLRTNILTANSVTSNALKVDTALINKLNTNNLLTSYLIANTAMIENIKSKSLEAVYANISELRTRLLVADVITANMVKFDTALIEKFTSSTAFINSLTAKSAFISNVKAIDITASRIISEFDGDNTTIQGGRMTSTGKFDRTFDNGATASYISRIRSANGVFLISTIDKLDRFGNSMLNTDWTGRGLFYSEKAIGTQIDNFARSSNRTGRYIDFYSSEVYTDGYTGSGMEIYSDTNLNIKTGYRSNLNLISDSHTWLESYDSIWLRPMVNRVEGDNTFRFYVYDGETLADKAGLIQYGSTVSGAGVAIMMSKRIADARVSIVKPADYSLGYLRARATEVDEVLANNNHVFLGVSSSGEVRAVRRYKLDDYASVRALGFSGQYLQNNSFADGLHLYLRTFGGGEIKITQADTTDSYRDIRYRAAFEMSHEDYKTDIQEWKSSVLDVFRNHLKLNKFKVKDEVETEYARYHHGIVLRRDSNLDTFPVEWRHKDGYDSGEVMWWTVKGVQELAYENDTLKNRINDLENKLNKIMEMIA